MTTLKTMRTAVSRGIRKGATIALCRHIPERTTYRPATSLEIQEQAWTRVATSLRKAMDDQQTSQR